MDAVGHHAIAKCVEAEALAVEFELRTAIVIYEENNLIRLWWIVALNIELRLIRNGDPRQPKQADNLPLAGRKVNKLVAAPICSICYERHNQPTSSFSLRGGVGAVESTAFQKYSRKSSICLMPRNGT